jgi:phosphatidylserine decarboxylase
MAALKLILSALIAALVLTGFGAMIAGMGVALKTFAPVVGGVWALFTLFTLYFFRDPTARVPAGSGIVLSPAHATVDVIDTAAEPDFMGGQCQRISMFLSVLNVHVQNAPVSGKVSFLKYTRGRFLNALKTESAIFNENVLSGFMISDIPGMKIGVRLIAGAIARRIVPFVQPGDNVARGDRVSLIQFGSRADVYLPAEAKIQVKLGDKVVGGETVLAVFQ